MQFQLAMNSSARDGPLERSGIAVRPAACRAWGLDLDAFMLPNGQPLWDSLRLLGGSRHPRWSATPLPADSQGEDTRVGVELPPSCPKPGMAARS